MNLKLTEDFKKKIYDFYMSEPMSYSRVCDEFNISSPTVCKVLKNCKKYSKNQIFNPNFDENFFETIDDEYKAYFLGLMISDGNVFGYNFKNTLKSISITLKENDKYILDEFKNILKTNRVVSHDGRGCCQLAVKSNKMADDLKKYGVIERKTLLTYLPKIGEDLVKDLIRGIMDGDGSISSHTMKNGKNLHFIAFCGTERLMEDISSYIYEKLNLSHKPKVYSYKNRMLSEFKVVAKNDMYKFGKWLYDGATIFLKRKHEIFLDFIKTYNLEQENTEVSSEITEGSETP